MMQRFKAWCREYRFEILFCVLYVLLMYIVIPLPFRVAGSVDDVIFIWVGAAAVFVFIACLCGKHFLFAILAVILLAAGLGFLLYEHSIPGHTYVPFWDYFALSKMEMFLITLASIPSAILGNLVRWIAGAIRRKLKNSTSE